MNKKTRYIAAAIIVATGLSLTSIPVVATEFMHIEIEPCGEAMDSYFAGGAENPAGGYHLGGYISSNVPVMVMIYNRVDLIYCNENCSHQIDEHIEKGIVKVIVTNNQHHTANVSYCLKTGDFFYPTLRLSHVRKKSTSNAAPTNS